MNVFNWYAGRTGIKDITKKLTLGLRCCPIFHKKSMSTAVRV